MDGKSRAILSTGVKVDMVRVGPGPDLGAYWGDRVLRIITCDGENPQDSKKL